MREVDKKRICALEVKLASLITDVSLLQSRVARFKERNIAEKDKLEVSVKVREETIRKLRNKEIAATEAMVARIDHLFDTIYSIMDHFGLEFFFRSNIGVREIYKSNVGVRKIGKQK